MGFSLFQGTRLRALSSPLPNLGLACAIAFGVASLQSCSDRVCDLSDNNFKTTDDLDRDPPATTRNLCNGYMMAKLSQSNRAVGATGKITKGFPSRSS